tara:strand:- start:2299 stop:3282 length:984 start_codon:yes stop_codon:yes gene_type:complete
MNSKIDDPILQVKKLNVEFDTPFGVSKVLNGVSFDLARGECLGILGESGSGKSVTAMAVMGLLPSPPSRVAGGTIFYNQRDLLALSKTERRKLQSREIAMIFQDATTSLNPGLTVGFQIAELFRLHLGDNRASAREKTIKLMDRVGIPSPEKRFGQYSHQFSGGMNQRIMIAMAIALEPRILIADEPTTALDVTIQAQILDLLKELQDETGMSIIFITHDLGVASEVSDRVAVVYAGKIVEIGRTVQTLGDPKHPYTQALKRSAPSTSDRFRRLEVIRGVAPQLMASSKGCAFAPRCQLATELCRTTEPPHCRLDQGRTVQCHIASK